MVLDFEGLGDAEQILDYYDGGFGSLGSGPGPDFDITFGPDALSLIDSDAGGSGNFANEPSQDTIAFFLTGPGVVMNVLNGFTTGFSFFYSSSQAGTVTVFDGFNGTGNVLATIAVVNQFNACGASGDPTGDFACWTPVGVTFSGTAFSVNFGGVANQTGFDEITLGSSLPGVSVESVVIDIKPGSCPNSFNRNNKGVLPVAVLGTDDFDVTLIDLSTVQLSRSDGFGGFVDAIRPAFEDVATAFDGELCDCLELGGDGVLDLSIKFSSPLVTSVLELDEFLKNDLVLLDVTGFLLDGTEFRGSDCIRIVK